MPASCSHSAPKSRSRCCTLAAICAKTTQNASRASRAARPSRRAARTYAVVGTCAGLRAGTLPSTLRCPRLHSAGVLRARCFIALCCIRMPPASPRARRRRTRRWGATGSDRPDRPQASSAHDRPNPTVSFHQHRIQPHHQRGTPNQGWAASSQGRTHGLMSSTGVLWRISIAENSSSPGSAEQCSAMPSCATTRCSSAARSGAEHCRLRSAAQRSAARSVASQMMTVGRNTVQLDEREAYRVRPVGRARRKHPNLQS